MSTDPSDDFIKEEPKRFTYASALLLFCVISEALCNVWLDFVVFGETSFFELGIDEFTVYGYLKPTPAGGDEGEAFNILLEFFEEFFRQTDGLGFVASSRAVFDFEFGHRDLLVERG
ncbi:MAG: hypothetical protein O2954_05765 [bacterium]|nr:hypothetical protein [bacterium]